MATRKPTVHVAMTPAEAELIADVLCDYADRTDQPQHRALADKVAGAIPAGAR